MRPRMFMEMQGIPFFNVPQGFASFFLRNYIYGALPERRRAWRAITSRNNNLARGDDTTIAAVTDAYLEMRHWRPGTARPDSAQSLPLEIADKANGVQGELHKEPWVVIVLGTAPLSGTWSIKWPLQLCRLQVFLLCKGIFLFFLSTFHDQV